MSDKNTQSSNERLAQKIGELLVEAFSVKKFDAFFPSLENRPDWTKENSLGIWYALAYLCLVSAVDRAVSTEESNGFFLDAGLRNLLNQWNMPSSSFRTFKAFNGAKILPAFNLYRAINNSDKARLFFTQFIIEIQGKNASFESYMFDRPILDLFVRSVQNFSTVEDSLASYFLDVDLGLAELIKEQI